MSFRDGFLYKTVAMKSISIQNIHPTFDELEKFRQTGEGGDGEMASLSTLFRNRKKVCFMKGDRVIVVKGDLRDRKGRVEKFEEDTIHIRPNEKDLPMETLAFSDKELRKYFEVGDHVKVISGSSEGVIGMVESVEGHVVSLISNTTKESLCVFTDNVVQSSEVTSSLTRFGEYELRDLVKLDNKNFGVIIRVDGEVFQVLKGVPDRPEVALVRLREIKEKVEKKGYAQDHFNNQLTVKDVVKVIEGPCKGNPFSSRSARLTTPSRVPQSPMRSSIGGLRLSYGGSHRDGRGHGTLVGADVKICLGPFKGCKGRVRNIKGTSVFVELEAQMKVVPVDRNHILDNVDVSTSIREPSGYGLGRETPSHPPRTPLHPCMTPLRDPGATPIHDGMRT